MLYSSTSPPVASGQPSATLHPTPKVLTQPVGTRAMENSLAKVNSSLELWTLSEYVTSSTVWQDPVQGLNLPLQVFFGLVIICVLLLAFLGNMVVCLMVYQRAAMRSAINILLASLAFADMMLAVLNMPFALVTMVTTRWIFGDTFCRVSAMFFWMFLMEELLF